MTEQIISYLWKFQKFNHRDLETTDGSKLTIYNPGYLNSNAGPDFGEARIKLNWIEWYGNVEIHVNSSDWAKHGHSNDSAYQNVILHVVWNHDEEVFTGSYQIPVLELRGKVSTHLINKAEDLLKNLSEIPCQHHYKGWQSLQTQSALESAAIERLERKSQEIKKELEVVNGDWEEAFYRGLASNLGFKVNKEAFYNLARNVPHRVLMKCAPDPIKLEAILMGAAGHLNLRIKDPHFILLKKEFEFLSKKFGIEEMENPGWKFLRMRPANFPTCRIAQLASIYTKYPNLFRKIMEAESIKELRSILKVSCSDYWQHHYLFGHTSPKRKTELGNSAVDLIIINTVIPFLFSYGKLNDLSVYSERALELLQSVSPEDNRITRKWKELGIPLSSSLQTQGSIQLFQSYCLERKCLQCKIGVQCLSEASQT